MNGSQEERVDTQGTMHQRAVVGAGAVGSGALERENIVLRSEVEAARVRERATLEALAKAGEAHVDEDFDEAYDQMYWLLVDYYGMAQLPGGPFESARSALNSAGAE